MDEDGSLIRSLIKRFREDMPAAPEERRKLSAQDFWWLKPSNNSNDNNDIQRDIRGIAEASSDRRTFAQVTHQTFESSAPDLSLSLTDSQVLDLLKFKDSQPIDRENFDENANVNDCESIYSNRFTTANSTLSFDSHVRNSNSSLDQSALSYASRHSRLGQQSEPEDYSFTDSIVPEPPNCPPPPLSPSGSDDLASTGSPVIRKFLLRASAQPSAPLILHSEADPSATSESMISPRKASGIPRLVRKGDRQLHHEHQQRPIDKSTSPTQMLDTSPKRSPSRIQVVKAGLREILYVGNPTNQVFRLDEDNDAPRRSLDRSPFRSPNKHSNTSSTISSSSSGYHSPARNIHNVTALGQLQERDDRYVPSKQAQNALTRLAAERKQSSSSSAAAADSTIAALKHRDEMMQQPNKSRFVDLRRSDEEPDFSLTDSFDEALNAKMAALLKKAKGLVSSYETGAAQPQHQPQQPYQSLPRTAQAKAVSASAVQDEPATMAPVGLTLNPTKPLDVVDESTPLNSEAKSEESSTAKSSSVRKLFPVTLATDESIDDFCDAMELVAAAEAAAAAVATMTPAITTTSTTSSASATTPIPLPLPSSTSTAIASDLDYLPVEREAQTDQLQQQQQQHQQEQHHQHGAEAAIREYDEVDEVFNLSTSIESDGENRKTSQERNEFPIESKTSAVPSTMPTTDSSIKESISTIPVQSDSSKSTSKLLSYAMSYLSSSDDEGESQDHVNRKLRPPLVVAKASSHEPTQVLSSTDSSSTAGRTNSKSISPPPVMLSGEELYNLRAPLSHLAIDVGGGVEYIPRIDVDELASSSHASDPIVMNLLQRLKQVQTKMKVNRGK